MELVEGALIAGKYQVTRLLGEGGMATVYGGRHVELGYLVAIKVMREEGMRDPEAVTRFYREAQAVAALRTPNVAKVYDVGTLDDKRPFLVMEFLDGVDLDKELARRGTIPAAEAVGWVLEAALAVADAHAAGIVHRDLKPANLFLANERGRRVVKVVDFGISRMVQANDTRLTQTQSAFGTPLYMAPESVRSAKLADERTDVWALGVILYELLSGSPPFLGETATAVAVSVTIDEPPPLSQRVPGSIPAELEEVVRRAMRKRPEERFQSALELAEALRAFQTSASSVSPAQLSLPGQPVAARPPLEPAVTNTSAPVSKSQAPPRQGLKVAVAAGVVFALGVGAIGLSLTRSERKGSEGAAATSAPATTTTSVTPGATDEPIVKDPPSTNGSAVVVQVVPTAAPSALPRASATSSTTAPATTATVEPTEPPPPALVTAAPTAPPATTSPPAVTAKPTATPPSPSSTTVRGSPVHI